MNPLVNALQNKGITTVTTNGAKAYTTTKNAVLDLFAAWGGMRGKNISGMFHNAMKENKTLAIRCILWGRDVRQGAGERQLFRNCLNELNNKNFYDFDPERILAKIPELGRWDDLLTLHGSTHWPLVVKLIRQALFVDKNGLCAKWMPRKGPIAATLRNDLNLTPKQYRKTLVELTKVVETQMCAQQWNKINYNHVPSKATQIYRKAFKRHDKTRYQEYIDGLKKGTSKVNASAVYPYEVLKIARQGNDMAEAQWKALPDFVGNQSFLPIIDCSGSMHTPVPGSRTTCLDVALSLGIYLAERNKGAFKNLFATFSEQPTFHYLVQGSLKEKYEQLNSSHWSMNTNLQATFERLLSIAVKNKTKPEDMPTHLLIVSDMQFDRCCKGTNHTNIEKQYEAHGYKQPILVFWNVNHYGNFESKQHAKNIVLVSGFSPSIMKTLLSGTEVTPYDQMLETLMQPRYNF